MAWCCDMGEGTVKDHTKAMEWYRKAAEQGYNISQYNLGVCYEYGYGVEPDLAMALEWFAKASRQ